MWERLKSLWRANKKRYAEAVNRYGVPVIVTAIALRLIMAVTVLGLYKLGMQFEALSTADAGLFVGAWVLVWPLAPVRWIAAAAIAPPIVRRFRAWRGLDPKLPPAEQELPERPADDAP